jgi:hypothetical protein
VPDTTNISSGLYDKSNELDLEIHLSSVSECEKSMKSRQLKEHVPIESQQIIASRATEINAPYCQQGSRIPSPSGCKLASSAPLVVPDDNITRYDDVGDQSHPEIVMEQEELSDSEEDIEEHVEFECEEMADSEGEDGSGCEQASEVQNKVGSLFFLHLVLDFNRACLCAIYVTNFNIEEKYILTNFNNVENNKSSLIQYSFFFFFFNFNLLLFSFYVEP